MRFLSFLSFALGLFVLFVTAPVIARADCMCFCDAAGDRVHRIGIVGTSGACRERCSKANRELLVCAEIGQVKRSGSNSCQECVTSCISASAECAESVDPAQGGPKPGLLAQLKIPNAVAKLEKKRQEVVRACCKYTCGPKVNQCTGEMPN